MLRDGCMYQGSLCFIVRFMIDFKNLLIQYDRLMRASLLLVLLSAALCNTVEVLSSNLSTQNDEDSSNGPLNSQDDSLFDNPLFIGLIVLLAFNLVVFILVYGCRRCLKLPYQVNISHTRQHFGQRYPNLRFQTQSYCLIEQETFLGRDCYESSEQLANLPAFIYGREVDAQVSHLDLFTIRQCGKCGGLTKTLEIFKYGKLRECWETLFMILISPCFLAFTIQRITSNNILWRKFFCTECGFEKPVQH